MRTTSNRETAKALGLPRRSVDYTVNKIIRKAEEAGHTEIVAENPRVLFIDIETAPALSYVWSMFQKGPINHEMQVHRTEMLGYCAKWLGEDEVLRADRREDDMLEKLWLLLDRADFVVAHNGDRFDIKRINTEFLLAGYKPTTPYKQIDTLKMVRRAFGFDSNRLDYLCRVLFGEKKQKHDGFDTWIGCMQDDPKAWQVMMDYNEKDVILLERLYLEVRAWDKSHPNILLGAGRDLPDVPCCTTCGSVDVAATGLTVQTNSGQYKGWECGDCGAQMRGRQNVTPLERRRVLLTRAK